MNPPFSRREFLYHVGGGLSGLALAPLAAGAGKAESPANNASPQFPPKVLSFCAAKERQVQLLAKRLKAEVLSTVAEYFEAAKKGDWGQASDLFREARDLLHSSSASENQNTLDATASAAMLEVQLALEAFVEGDPKYALAFGNDMIASLPQGSIYFGGTDPGRGLVTALAVSHENADPCFTLTQNALADGRYLTYLRTMYGDRIYTPSKQDSDHAFQDYLSDAQRRLDHDEKFPKEPRQLKPGENVQRAGNRVNVSGHLAVMAINGRLAKVIFDKNPKRDFFIEESFPLDWMYPHLSPHGLILKLNRKPLATLSPTLLETDRQYWLGQQRNLIGEWLRIDTPVAEICRFAQKVFGDRDVGDFKGDLKFVQSTYACKS